MVDAAQRPARAFVRRWQVEVTFAEMRAHLGMETQRQWSDNAIARTMPVLFGLYNLTCLWACDLFNEQSLPRAAIWYRKTRLTFSDAIGVVRHTLWVGEIYRHPPKTQNHRKFRQSASYAWQRRSASPPNRTKSS